MDTLVTGQEILNYVAKTLRPTRNRYTGRISNDVRERMKACRREQGETEWNIAEELAIKRDYGFWAECIRDMPHIDDLFAE